MNGMRIALIIIYLISFHLPFYSQAMEIVQKDRMVGLGLTFQWYPAGIIATANAEVYSGHKSSILFRIGGNFANRKDFSHWNDNEKGNGFGVTVGFRKHFIIGKGELITGLNADVWNMWINWKNNTGELNQTRGVTYTLVLQPLIEAGYFRSILQTPLKAGIGGGFGREINVFTKGKAVGQGWMGSILLSIQYNFK